MKLLANNRLVVFCLTDCGSAPVARAPESDTSSGYAYINITLVHVNPTSAGKPIARGHGDIIAQIKDLVEVGNEEL